MPSKVSIKFLVQRTDLVVADLTITYEREQVVDFTMPFMNLGTYKKLPKLSTNSELSK